MVTEAPLEMRELDRDGGVARLVLARPLRGVRRGVRKEGGRVRRDGQVGLVPVQHLFLLRALAAAEGGRLFVLIVSVSQSQISPKQS